jgi:DNA-binding CsgD family transcriptional regulator
MALKLSHKTLVRYSLVLFLLVFSGLATIDVVVDLNQGVPTTHIYHEVFLILFSLVLLGYQFYFILNQGERLEKKRQTISALSTENEKLRQSLEKLKNEMSDLVERQLKEWSLTEGESDVARLILKGSSMKDIALIRQTSEPTVRQQASDIYKKAHVKNRQELLAVFLEIKG